MVSTETPLPPYAFLKGHGTENDFIVLPDLDGAVHGDLSVDRVRTLCDRRSGIGGDGVLRVLRRDDGWLMDYRNADGSPSQMCGNGIRVLARYLVEEGLADGRGPISIDTRDGIKTVIVDGDRVTVDMGRPRVLGDTWVSVGEVSWPAWHVDVGNPHAVALVDDLAVAGPLLTPPVVDPHVYPDGVNVEFVVRRGDRHVAMRVHERGSGETRSCGTGACAVMVAAASVDGVRDESRDTTYRVDVPGGSLEVTWTADDRVRLTGPAVIVARGTTSL